ncbi:uroporphyrinogen-III C-methyltransferase [Halomonas salinarum]|uniref:uroporphyrinogen-III C-methyltransferase n=1 Tax=Halomonas salinarum TaxID=1158993 RepID=UPI001439750A|nr:uroporphyrinogen-III C-methyltransferase [Halomonas salinarum]
MSKQSHDQDEPQQAPGTSASAAAAQSDTSSSGAESSTGGASDASTSGASNAGETNKASTRGRPRGRRGGKGRTSNNNQDNASRDNASAEGSAEQPAAAKNTETTASGSNRQNADSKASSGKSANTQGAGAQGATAQGSSSQGSSNQGSSNQSAGSKNAAESSSGASSSKAASSKPSPSQPSSTSGGSAGSGSGAHKASGGNGGGRQTIGIVALILVILLAIGVVVAGWFGWQRFEQQQQRLAQVESNREAVSALETRLEETEQSRAAALDEAVASVEGEFADYRSEVDDTLDRVLDELNSQQQTDEREWLHAEAAYLLRLANQRLQLERDVGGAMALLETADKRLKETGNPALLPVRRAIADELAKLDAVPDVDRTGLYLSLNAQQEQLASLPLKQDVAEAPVEGTIETPPSGDWQQQLSRFGSELKDLVTVRRHDQALEALMTPEQESYLRQNVRLVLEQAQLALLKEEPELYRASLDKAISLIEGYYDTERESVEASISRLTDMRGKTIRPELPDISGSQQAMAHFIQTRFEARAQGGDA